MIMPMYILLPSTIVTNQTLSLLGPKLSIKRGQTSQTKRLSILAFSVLKISIKQIMYRYFFNQIGSLSLIVSALPGEVPIKIKLNLPQYFNCQMSYYRDSPSQYSRRSPPRIERQLVEEELNLKNALRSEAENRRLLDQISLLQIKLRKTEELEFKVDGLIKQNSSLSQDNDQLARELSERRYELERLKTNTIQLQERDTIKTSQLAEINRSLQLQIDLLKKERLESNKLYEAHIQKLEFMLEDKIKELDMLAIRCNDLINLKEGNEIKFQEQKNKLKNLIARTNHDMERELEYTKEKNTAEKSVQIDTLKKNYTSQILLLEDEISKLKGANDYKHNEFENQLAENKNLRMRYDQQLKSVELQNIGLREKIVKLQEMNRDEVVNIEVKYQNIQKKDSSDLITGHVNEIKTLIADIDKLNWIVRNKSEEIQNLIRDKRQQKNQEEERELAFRAEIETLKNKLEVQGDKAAEDNQELNKRINSLATSLQRDSEAYHDRVNQLNQNINALQNELNSKQNQLDRIRTENSIQSKEQRRVIEELSDKLDSTRRELNQCIKDRQAEKRENEEFREQTYQDISGLEKKNRELETVKEELNEKLERHADTSGDQEKVLRVEIDSLKKNIQILERNLSDEQSRHASEMSDLSANLKAKLERLQAQQKKTITEFQESRTNEVETLNSRIEKANRDREEANKKLLQYVQMFQNLERHFKNPSEGSICRERGQDSLFETFSKTKESVINLF